MNYKKVFLNALAIITSVFVAILFMYFMYFHFFLNLGDFTLNLFSKYLGFTLTDIDHVIVWLFPMLLIYPILKKHIPFAKHIFLYTLISLISIFISILFGVLIAVFTWPSEDASLYLPNYFLIQPFKHYWTVFIVIGVIIPLIFLLRRKVNHHTL